jgi:hypothetical protein
MKIAADMDISTSIAASLQGNDVQPLSNLAAQTESERAEHFAFTDEDQRLLDKVLADGGDPA